MPDGTLERVYLSTQGDLGINASNESYLEWHNASQELYPLYIFNLGEIEVIDENEMDLEL